MGVKDIMVNKAVTVNPDATVRDAAKLMNKQARNPKKTRAHEVMSKPLRVGRLTWK